MCLYLSTDRVRGARKVLKVHRTDTSSLCLLLNLDGKHRKGQSLEGEHRSSQMLAESCLGKGCRTMVNPRGTWGSIQALGYLTQNELAGSVATDFLREWEPSAGGLGSPQAGSQKD